MTAIASGAFHRVLVWWVDLVCRRAGFVVAATLLLTAMAGWYVAANLAISTRTTDMLSAELQFRKDEILIDRGDLSRRVPIEKVPFLQRRIISFARSRKTPVFVATNLLESMVTRKSPTRAEVNDVVSTLLMGADGLVLAAETAIGGFPVEAVAMIRKLIDESGRWTPDTSLTEILGG